MRLGETPVPIPNTMVKTQEADGTMLETAWESRWLPDSLGGLAQLGERLPCKQEVAGSIPTISTIPQKHTLLRGAKKQYNSQSFKIRAEPSEAGLRGRGDAAK